MCTSWFICSYSFLSSFSGKSGSDDEDGGGDNEKSFLSDGERGKIQATSTRKYSRGWRKPGWGGSLRVGRIFTYWCVPPGLMSGFDTIAFIYRLDFPMRISNGIRQGCPNEANPSTTIFFFHFCNFIISWEGTGCIYIFSSFQIVQFIAHFKSPSSACDEEGDLFFFSCSLFTSNRRVPPPLWYRLVASKWDEAWRWKLIAQGVFLLGLGVRRFLWPSALLFHAFLTPWSNAPLHPAPPCGHGHNQMQLGVIPRPVFYEKV